MKRRLLFLALASVACCSVANCSRSVGSPLLAIDFGGQLPNSPIQIGFDGMWGTADAVTTSTIGPYTIELGANNTQTGVSANRGFINKIAGRIDDTDASIRDFYRGYYYNRSPINGDGISLRLSGLTPNQPYTLTLASFDPDASANVAAITVIDWSPAAGSNTTGTSTAINLIRTPVPTSVFDPAYSGSMQVSTSTGVLDVFGTVAVGSVGVRGAVLNGFKLNDGTNDVLSVDLGEGAPAGNEQIGFVGVVGDSGLVVSHTEVVGAYTVTVEAVGQYLAEAGFYNTPMREQGSDVLTPPAHAFYRDYFGTNSTIAGDGLRLTIDGVTPEQEYDLKIWSHDPATAATEIRWSPTDNTTGNFGDVTMVRTPVPSDVDDPSKYVLLRVKASDSSLDIFGGFLTGPGGTRINGFELTAVPAIAGDFNNDGSVNGDDLAIWKEHFGASVDAAAADGDADGDQDVDGEDFLVWQRNLTGGAVAAIPEPASGSILAVASSILYFARNRSKQ